MSFRCAFDTNSRALRVWHSPHAGARHASSRQVTKSSQQCVYFKYWTISIEPEQNSGPDWDSNTRNPITTPYLHIRDSDFGRVLLSTKKTNTLIHFSPNSVMVGGSYAYVMCPNYLGQFIFIEASKYLSAKPCPFQIKAVGQISHNRDFYSHWPQFGHPSSQQKGGNVWCGVR